MRPMELKTASHDRSLPGAMDLLDCDQRLQYLSLVGTEHPNSRDVLGLHAEQPSGLVPMDQSPQEGGGLDGKSLNSSRNDGEGVF